MKNEDIRLGSIITDDAHRDAIHVAIAPVEAAEALGRAEWCKLNEKGMAVGCSMGEAIGIVDPYLFEGVSKGQRFYLCLKPYTVTSLRHVWTHPAFRVKVPGGL